MTCPALEAPLCSRCCGTGRGVSIDCTVDCTTNPFGKAGYERFQEIDSALTAKLFKAMAQDGYDYRRMLSESKGFMLVHKDDDPMATGSFAVIQDWIFHQQDTNGQTRLQRWEAEGWPGFSNDEHQLLRMRQGTQLTLVELLSTEGDHMTRVKDIIPALQGKTPRETSKSSDTQLQKIFEQWAKSMIHSQSRKTAEHGYIPDLFWFYQELNLAHLWPSDWPKG